MKRRQPSPDSQSRVHPRRSPPGREISTQPSEGPVFGQDSSCGSVESSDHRPVPLPTRRGSADGSPRAAVPPGVQVSCSGRSRRSSGWPRRVPERAAHVRLGTAPGVIYAICVPTNILCLQCLPGSLSPLRWCQGVALHNLSLRLCRHLNRAPAEPGSTDHHSPSRDRQAADFSQEGPTVAELEAACCSSQRSSRVPKLFAPVR